MSPVKKAAEVARQPIVMLSGSAVIAILAVLGFKNEANKVSAEPSARLLIIANTLEQTQKQNSKSFDRLNENFDKLVQLYTDTRSDIGILKTQVGHNEQSIEQNQIHIREMEHRWSDPVNGND